MVNDFGECDEEAGWNGIPMFALLYVAPISHVKTYVRDRDADLLDNVTPTAS